MQVDYLRARVYCSGLTAVGTLSSPNVYVLHSDHHSLKFLHYQTHKNHTHARWLLVLQKFTFVIEHRVVAKQNKAANALSRKAYLLVTLQPLVTSFESLHDQYSSDEDFAAIWDKCTRHEPVGNFSISKGYLFKGHQLCIHKT